MAIADCPPYLSSRIEELVSFQTEPVPGFLFSKEGTLWLHHEGICSKRAIGYRGESKPTILV
jgi:hypothetical protein